MLLVDFLAIFHVLLTQSAYPLIERQYTFSFHMTSNES